MTLTGMADGYSFHQKVVLLCTSVFLYLSLIRAYTCMLHVCFVLFDFAAVADSDPWADFFDTCGKCESSVWKGRADRSKAVLRLA